MKDQIGRNVYAYLMSYWEDLDDHLGRLEPSDLNLDYVGVSHLDCVSRVSDQSVNSRATRPVTIIFASPVALSFVRKLVQTLGNIIKIAVT